MAWDNYLSHPTYSLREQPGRDIDAEREDNRIEGESEHAMKKGGPADGAARDLDIRSLTSHPDDEREIGEVKEVGMLLFWKDNTDTMGMGFGARAPAVENVSIMHRHHRMHEQP